LPPPRMTSLSQLRVAVWPDEAIAPVDASVSGRIAEVADRLAGLGATVSDTARPAVDPARYLQTYQTLLFAVMGGSEPLTHPAWSQLDGVRTSFRVAWHEFFRDWDVVLCPMMATAAFPHDHRPMEERTLPINGEARPYFDQIFWAALATLCYLPATVFPTGPSAGGLPIGLQAIGPAFEDRTTIELARLLGRELGGYRPPPGYGA
ncbi:MAG: amidase family protein, partial [Thermoanaerobaculia bacterium]|nr:amidase family protein [Thermoanaerobaculia bacterium]